MYSVKYLNLSVGLRYHRRNNVWIKYMIVFVNLPENNLKISVYLSS